MIFVLTFLNFAFGTHSNGICHNSRHLVLGLRVQSTSVIVMMKILKVILRVLKKTMILESLVKSNVNIVK